MAGSHGSFDWEQTDLFRRAPGVSRRIDNMIAVSTEFMTTRAENHAKSHAPWNDQTTNARNGLTASTFHIPGRRHGITLSHGVPYGIWLEVRFSGRNRIIVPTILVVGPQLMDLIGRNWGRAVTGALGD